MHRTQQTRIITWAIISLVVASVWIGLQYGACTQDDAFISFRYAEHLLRGEGLVFNPGDRVEGYTNLSWTLMLALFMALGAEPVVASILMGLASLVGGLALTAVGTRHLGFAAVFAVSLVGLDVLLVLEAVEGLETVMFMGLVTGSFLGMMRGRDALAGCLLAVACLTRPEGVLVSGLMYIGLCADSLVRKSGFQKAFLRGIRAAVPVVVTLCLLTAWRMWFYGDPLPNTFYAKTGGLAVARGLVYIGWHALLHPALYGLVLLRVLGGRLRAETIPAAVVAFGYLAYVVLVGGDFKPTGRFVIPVIPLLALLAAEGATGVHKRFEHSSLRLAVPVLCVVLLAWGAGRMWPIAQQTVAVRHANLEARRTVGEWLAEHTPQSTVLAIHSAGVVPFYADRHTIDMWGLTDRHIARSETPTFGQGLAGHEKTDPQYVFSQNPDLYLPEDKMFTLRPQTLVPDDNFPDDFLDRYRQQSIPVEGRWLNLWVRREFMGGLWGR